jgi:hypothetical protein
MRKKINTKGAKMIKFEEGKTYTNGNKSCKVEVLKRTTKTVTIITDQGKEGRRKIIFYNGKEQFFPFGRYSMAPVISADRPVEEVLKLVTEARERYENLIIEAETLLSKISMKINDHAAKHHPNINWGHVGDINYIVKKLEEVLG